MKQKSLLTILFSLMVVLALQTQQRIVTGKIIDKASNTALPNVSILEKTSGKGVISNTEGDFEPFSFEDKVGLPMWLE
ncbi:MAG: hypothetical protein ACOVO2_06710 [Emticicia sp.]|uniref:hypothetical protein n=1 Tax=Emticicia sp. TaxID=1930953 RepID=UPI003BA79AED